MGKHRFLRAAELVRELRDSACGDPSCSWCREQNDRTCCCRLVRLRGIQIEPAGPTGQPLQREIVANALAGKSQIGILPAGTGKFRLLPASRSL